MLLELREERLRLVVRDTGVDDNVVTLLPVDGGGNAVLVAELERVDYSEDLVKGSANLGRVGDGEADDLLGVDHEDLNQETEWLTL